MRPEKNSSQIKLPLSLSNSPHVKCLLERWKEGKRERGGNWRRSKKPGEKEGNSKDMVRKRKSKAMTAMGEMVEKVPGA